MDKIKEAFTKVREDMNSLYKELNSMKNEMGSIKEEISLISDILLNFTSNQEEKNPIYSSKNLLRQTDRQTHSSTHNTQNQTSSTHSSTHDSSLKPLNTQNMGISTRNRGVSTDRQTDKQTNRHTPISTGNSQEDDYATEIQHTNSFLEKRDDSIENAAKILDSLDSIKKEIRLKFKRLTDQEVLVFSTLYQLDEENGYTDYKSLAEKLNLTESSIRDYVGRLIKKGIPVEKTRVNNKFIHLGVSDSLKKIASLPTILRLRDI